MAQSVGDKDWTHVVPATVHVVVVEVLVERDVWESRGLLEASADAEECLDRAEERVVVGGVANDFASHGILLVSELKCSVRGALYYVLVIQRCLRGAVDPTIDRELDMLVLKGLGTSARAVRFEVFGWSQQPVERDDDQVGDGSVEDAIAWVCAVESVG